ncbi:hypothetical protein ABTF44_20250, partial [Acinetobacter baumannii]
PQRTAGLQGLRALVADCADHRMHMLRLVGGDVGFIMDGASLPGCTASTAGFFGVAGSRGVSGNGTSYGF